FLARQEAQRDQDRVEWRKRSAGRARLASPRLLPSASGLCRRMDCIYLDNNATTPVLPAVWEAMRPYFGERAGNPASSHHAGRHARQALEKAREQTAALLDAAPDEGPFTSRPTEANHLAIFALVR